MLINVASWFIIDCELLLKGMYCQYFIYDDKRVYPRPWKVTYYSLGQRLRIAESILHPPEEIDMFSALYLFERWVVQLNQRGARVRWFDNENNHRNWHCGAIGLWDRWCMDLCSFTWGAAPRCVQWPFWPSHAFGAGSGFLPIPIISLLFSFLSMHRTLCKIYFLKVPKFQSIDYIQQWPSLV